MHGTHEHADNLFLRLSSYSPSKKRDRLEDFCTEGLVWCLRNSVSFRLRFFELTKIPRLQQHREVIIHSQQTYRDEMDDENDRLDRAGRFDIAVEAVDRSFFVAIECKIGSPFGKGQIAKYFRYLQTTRKRGSYEQCELVTLTNVRDAIVPNVVHLFWGQVHEALIQAHAEIPLAPSANNSYEVPAIVRQFATFLELKKLQFMKIPKTDITALKEFVRGVSLRESLDGILMSLKTTDHLKDLLARKHPKITDPKINVEGEYDVYLAYEARDNPYFYVGFHIWDSDSSLTRLDMYIECSVTGDQRKLKKQLQGKLGTTEVATGLNDGGGTWITFEQIVDDRYNGDAEAMREWFIKHTKEMLRISGGKSN